MRCVTITKLKICQILGICWVERNKKRQVSLDRWKEEQSSAPSLNLRFGKDLERSWRLLPFCRPHSKLLSSWEFNLTLKTKQNRKVKNWNLPPLHIDLGLFNFPFPSSTPSKIFHVTLSLNITCYIVLATLLQLYWLYLSLTFILVLK